MHIHLFAPAGHYPANNGKEARKWLQNNGYHVSGNTEHPGYYRFSAPDENRFHELKEALGIKADVALAIRGGYGVVRLLEKLDKIPVESFHHKLVAGFSDITALHCWIHKRLNWTTLHCEMANGLPTAASETTASFLKTINNIQRPAQIEWTPAAGSITGSAQGKLIGGNLSVLHGLLGSPWFPDIRDAVLFIEDIAEPWYKIDRMLWSFAHAGVFERIAGIITGHFSNMPANDTGMELHQMILEKINHQKVVYAGGLTAGHEQPNVCLLLNRTIQLNVQKDKAQMKWL
jgi:muramoyltetrapeptide carboxypeptidase